MCFFSLCGAGCVGKETNTQFTAGKVLNGACLFRNSKQNALAWPILGKKLAQIFWTRRRSITPRPGLKRTGHPVTACQVCDFARLAQGWPSIPLGSVLTRSAGYFQLRWHSFRVLFSFALQNCWACSFKLSVFDVFCKLPSSWSHVRSLAIIKGF